MKKVRYIGLERENKLDFQTILLYIEKCKKMYHIRVDTSERFLDTRSV